MIMIESIKNKIIRRIEAEWDQKNDAILLSKLGGFLSQAEREIIDRDFGGLAQFIRSELADSVSLFKFQKRGLCAVSREHELDVSFQSEDIISDSGASPLKSYETIVWQAFLSPISDGLQRFIDLTSMPKKLYDAEAAETDQHIAVHPSDIPATVAGGGRAEPSEIRVAIEKWSEQIENKNAIVRSFARSNRRSLSADNSLGIISIVLSLDDRDLRRISIPADIVKKMVLGIDRGK